MLGIEYILGAEKQCDDCIFRLPKRECEYPCYFDKPNWGNKCDKYIDMWEARNICRDTLEKD